MKQILLFIIIAFLGQLSIAKKTKASMMIELDDLVGKWYINKSNFPMWLEGDKTSPTFNYSILKKKNGKVKSINGFDKSLDSNNTKFIWRGHGFLRIVKSKWKIIHLNEEFNWAIIYFNKTFFTPAGYDVISKFKVLSESIENEIDSVLFELNISEKLANVQQL